MPQTLIEKIIANHSGGGQVNPGDIRELSIDVRAARDFGGANVVKNLETHKLGIENNDKTYFTFDCNPGGSDQKYATNQQLCRVFARRNGIRVYDIQSGIGTHVAIEQGLALPGDTLVSTDSHANILGAIGAFGQGMGDKDIASAFAYGRIWFKTPPTVKINITGNLPDTVSAKDLTLLLVKTFGASGLLGSAAEVYGACVDALPLSSRITIASMATEMGGIIMLFPPNEPVIQYCRETGQRPFEPEYADPGCRYDAVKTIDTASLQPLISRPGHPEDVVEVSTLAGIKIDSVFIGSCTNGRFDDMQEAAEILKGKKCAPGVVLKIVPATGAVWRRCLDAGLLKTFTDAGALIGNPGCAGCAAGQIGQNGPGEVTVSTGNRNFAGKQGRGEVFLASPATAAASAVAGHITYAGDLPAGPSLFPAVKKPVGSQQTDRIPVSHKLRPVQVRGRVRIIPVDNIDTDMIYHNRYLAVTDTKEMGQYTFDNLKGWEDFAQNTSAGDIIVTGTNFGAGSSRQQAVDCFTSLGITAIIARSFGAIYERNAVNAAFPVLTGDALSLQDGEIITVHFETGELIRASGERLNLTPFSSIQLNIYRRGGLLASGTV